MTKWEYTDRVIRQGGADCYDMADDLNTLGAEGWEFCEWVYEWYISSGSGPDTRVALLKRPVLGESDGW